MLAVSLVLAAAATALLVGPVTGTGSTAVARRVAVAGGRPAADRVRRGRRRWSPATVLLATAAVTLGILSSAVTGTRLAVVVIAAGSGLAVARMLAVSRRAGEAARRRSSVVDFCEALVGELRAGQPVLTALERSVPVWPEAAPVLAAARLDGDLPAALRRLSGSPGAEALAHLAAAWQLSAATGGGLAAATGLVLEAARTDASALHEVEGEASSARATARLVAALPLVVLSAGSGLGARPWAFLLGTPVGVACLGTGVALLLAGLAWIERIAASATAGG